MKRNLTLILIVACLLTSCRKQEVTPEEVTVSSNMQEEGYNPEGEIILGARFKNPTTSGTCYPRSG